MNEENVDDAEERKGLGRRERWGRCEVNEKERNMKSEQEEGKKKNINRGC